MTVDQMVSCLRNQNITSNVTRMAVDPKQNSIDGAEFAMIAFIAVMVAGVIYACYWLFQIPLSADGPVSIFDQRLERVSRIGLLTVGIVGFPLAIWRSVLSYRQTQESINQGQRVVLQIKAAEENSLAQLLEKGATLAADDNEAKVAAGLSLLRAIALSNNPMFQTEATGLLIDFVAGKYFSDTSPRAVVNAINYLSQIAIKTDTFIATEAYCKTRMEPTLYPSLRIRYELGYFNGVDFSELRLFNFFFDCEFFDCLIDDKVHVWGQDTRFTDCRIKSIYFRRLEAIPAAATMENCDFSGAKFFAHGALSLEDCFYYENDPPHPMVLAQFGSKLTPRVRE